MDAFMIERREGRHITFRYFFRSVNLLIAFHDKVDHVRALK